MAVAVVGLLTAQSALALQAILTTEKITLDGRLDEADWQRAPVSATFIENMPREKQPARDRTEVRMLFDHDALWPWAFGRTTPTRRASTHRSSAATRCSAIRTT